MSIRETPEQKCKHAQTVGILNKIRINVLTKHRSNFHLARNVGLGADIDGAAVCDEILPFRVLHGSLKIMRHQVL
jgi:hypothetical protein